MYSDALQEHFEAIRPTPPHEILRAQALEQAAKYGIPYEVASAAIDAKLCLADSLYNEMIETRESCEGKAGCLRAEIDAHLIANDVLDTANATRDARLAEIGATAIKDIRDMVAGGDGNLDFSAQEATIA